MRLAASAKRGNKSMRDVRGIFPSEGKVVKDPTEITESLRPDSGRGKILSDHTTRSKTDKESSFALRPSLSGAGFENQIEQRLRGAAETREPPEVTASRFSSSGWASNS